MTRGERINAHNTKLNMYVSCPPPSLFLALKGKLSPQVSRSQEKVNLQSASTASMSNFAVTEQIILLG